MDQREPIQNPPDPAKNSKFFKWLDNLWYHYKWHILIGLFVLVTVAVCVAQCAGREKYDALFVYAGDHIFSGEERDALSNSLGSALAQDYDKDGKKTVQLVTFTIFSEGAQPIGSADAERDLSNYLNTGECSVWLVSPYVYESSRLAERAVPLSETFGEDIPEGNVDGIAVVLQKTAFYKQFEKELSAVFPADAPVYLLLGKPTILGKAANEQQYERGKQLYLTVIGK